ncbi:MAG: hypothetical protein EHM42_00640 [Planctomycetaceae bacterium]|nr:MAG: hypothetical protein EHM42_00640 [Planctomycetaceae bacterium]
MSTFRRVFVCGWFLIAIGAIAAPLATVLAAEGVHVLYDSDSAVTLSRKTGRPLLAIGGTNNCSYCVKMANLLETKEELAPLAAKYVILKIDTSTPLWQEWQTRYEIEGDGVPKVVVLRGDGKQLYGQTGAPVDLDAFLTRQLEGAGKILSSQELADLDRLLKEATKAFKRRDYAKTIDFAQDCVQADCYAGAVADAQRLLAQVDDRARNGLKDAEKRLNTRDKALDGAMALLQLDQTFARHSTAHSPITQALEARRQDSSKAPLLDQAALALSAQRLETDKKRTEALAVWQELVEKHPDTPGAALAARRIADLERKAAGASPSSKALDGKEGPANSKRAASYLGLGKQLLKSKPGEARAYLEKAIAADPDSPAAEEARELLEKLDR